MSSFLRVKILACFIVSTIFAPGALAPAQVENAGAPAERKGTEVFNKLPGPLTILYIRAEGSLVKKGDLVCELDSSSLKEKLVNQEAATKVAEAAYLSAKRPRESAEGAVTEYVEAILKPELQTLNGRISLAEAQREKAEKQLETSKRQLEHGIATKERVTSDEIALQRARFALEQLQRKKTTLEKYTREKKIKTLQSEVEKARAEELAKQAAYGLAQAAQERLQKQIESCRVLAPNNGRVHFSPPIEEAAEVAEGQLLFRVIPEDEPKAGAK
jgi:multidrug efflux pump subunit AcrA (membrane-fusion protein)